MALTMSAIDFRDAATSNLKPTLIRKHLFIKRANNKNICCISVANIVKRQADFQKDEIIFQFHQPNGLNDTIHRCLVKPFTPRDGEVVSRQAHYLKVAGSNPAPATEARMRTGTKTSHTYQVL